MEEHEERVKVLRLRSVLLRIKGGISVVEGVFNDLGGALMILLMLGTVSEIVGRRAFNSPIRGYIEISELIMAGVVFLGLAYTQRMGGHIRVEMLVKKVSKVKERLYHMIESFTLLLSLFIFVIVTISSLQFTLNNIKVGNITSVLYLPTWPAQLIVPIACALLCVRLATQLIHHLPGVTGRPELREL